MNYEIKALKAPWPKGAKVGDVIDMPFLPAWAEGKCSVAADGAKADFTYDPSAVIVGDGTGVALPSVDAVNAEIADLQTKLAAATEGQAKAQEEAKAEKARADDLQTKLAAAEAAAQKASKKS